MKAVLSQTIFAGGAHFHGRHDARLLADLKKFDEAFLSEQRQLRQLVRRLHRQWQHRRAARAKSKKPAGSDTWAQEQWTRQRELIRTVKQQSKF